VDLEHAVLEVGLDGVDRDALRQGDRALEGAEAALVAVKALVLDLLGALALAGPVRTPFSNSDRDPVLGMPGRSNAYASSSSVFHTSTAGTQLLAPSRRRGRRAARSSAGPSRCGAR